MQIIRYSTLLGALVLATSTTIAAEFETQLGLSAEHSNNIALVEDNEQSDTEIRADAGINIEAQSRTLSTVVDYRFSALDYKRNTLDDETTIDGYADLNWEIIQSALSWQLRNSTQDLQRDRRETDIASNRESRNIFSTGPTANLRLSRVDYLSITALYTDTRFEDSESSDNQRNSGSLGWRHNFNATQYLTIAAVYFDTDFDASSAADIETTQLYASFHSELSNINWMIKAGYNESSRDIPNGETSGPLLEGRFNFTSGGQEFGLLAIHEITDSTIGLGQNEDIFTGDFASDDSNFTEIDIVERSFAEARYGNTLLCQNCTLGVRVAFDDQDFETLNRDEQSLLVGADFTYLITRITSVTLNLSQETIEFDDGSGREDELMMAGLTVNFALLPNLNLALRGAYQERDSNADGFEYEEGRGGIGLTYTF